MTIDLVATRPAARRSRLARYSVGVRCDRCGAVIAAGAPVRRFPIGSRSKYRVHVVGSGYSHDDLMWWTCCCVDCVE